MHFPETLRYSLADFRQRPRNVFLAVNPLLPNSAVLLCWMGVIIYLMYPHRAMGLSHG